MQLLDHNCKQESKIDWNPVSFGSSRSRKVNASQQCSPSKEWRSRWQNENGKKEKEGVGVDWLLGLRRSDEH
jgi:hypothetical protein